VNDGPRRAFYYDLVNNHATCRAPQRSQCNRNALGLESKTVRWKNCQKKLGCAPAKGAGIDRQKRKDIVGGKMLGVGKRGPWKLKAKTSWSECQCGKRGRCGKTRFIGPDSCCGREYLEFGGATIPRGNRKMCLKF